MINKINVLFQYGGCVKVLEHNKNFMYVELVKKTHKILFLTIILSFNSQIKQRFIFSKKYFYSTNDISYRRPIPVLNYQNKLYK
jgi:hypothetical protein